MYIFHCYSGVTFLHCIVRTLTKEETGNLQYGDLGEIFERDRCKEKLQDWSHCCMWLKAERLKGCEL